METMSKNAKGLMLGAGATYGLFKLPKKVIDPYTRTTLGVSIGIGIAAMQYRNPYLLYAAIGVIVGSALILPEVYEGGKLAFNDYGQTVYVLHETDGVKELQPNEVPDYAIDGLTIKGLNGVFKVSDGVYCKVSKDGTISTTFGIGALVNRYHGAGFKTGDWAKGIGDNRWVDLYNKSV